MMCRTALLAICSLLAVTVRAAGVREIVIPADSAGPAISVGLWTPCAVPPQPLKVDSGGAALTITAVKDCPPSAKALPLILISHGMFGDMFSHHDTAGFLADAGFAVAAVNHILDVVEDEIRQIINAGAL